MDAQFPILKTDRPFQKPDEAKQAADETATRLYEEVRAASVTVWTDRGVGSGFFVDKDGTVLSSAHVVTNTREIAVTTSDGRAYAAKIEAMADTLDLVKLKLEDFDATKNLKFIQMRESSKLKHGDQVYALGHPHGYRQAYLSPGEYLGETRVYDVVNKDKLAINYKTMTQAQKTDVVKAMSGEIIKTNAHLEPGNSGGMLVDTDGLLVGLAQLGNKSVSYYRPVEEVREFLKDGNKKFEFVYCGDADKKISAIRERTSLASRIDSIDRTDDGRFNNINYDSLFGAVGPYSGYIENTLLKKMPPRLCEIKRADGEQRLPFEWHSVPFEFKK